MTRPLRIVFSPVARRQASEAGRWWTENRSKAPFAFDDELEGALTLIAEQPYSGAVVRDAALSGVRRISLRRVRYLLYYRVSGAEERVEVLGLWHMSRGKPPKL